MQRIIERCVLELDQGDLTHEHTEAIVNAANSSLLGGGGVDGAIHRAGGPAILSECKKIRAAQGPLASGGAVITGGGRLLAKHVIHTVGPVWRGGAAGEAETLACCYRSCLALARQHKIRSVAFPAVSTGAYGFPMQQAAEISLQTVVDDLTRQPDSFDLIRFVLFDRHALDTYASVLVGLRIG